MVRLYIEKSSEGIFFLMKLEEGFRKAVSTKHSYSTN